MGCVIAPAVGSEVVSHGLIVCGVGCCCKVTVRSCGVVVDWMGAQSSRASEAGSVPQPGQQRLGVATVQVAQLTPLLSA
jgi:hypothetical protein